ncbi:MAG: hypothetical protein ABI581_02895 [Sediminibacterium sp.]
MLNGAADVGVITNISSDEPLRYVAGDNTCNGANAYIQPMLVLSPTSIL